MVRFSKEIQISAPRTIVWNAMMDVEKWHQWTSTIIRIKKLNAANVEVGTKLLIEQPKLPKAVWKVFEMAPEEGFSMKKGNSFLTVAATHKLRSSGNKIFVTLSLEFSGLFSNMVAKKYQPLMEKYLSVEAAGLKKVCEERYQTLASS